MKTKKKINKKKVIGIVAGVVVVLGAAQMVVLGYMGGIGPLKFLRDQRMAKLPGNAEQYHLENVQPLAQSPLQGMTICFLGSSVTNGSASMRVSMADYIGKLDGANIIKEAVNGTTLAGTGGASYSSRLVNNVDADAKIDLLVCQLSTNDASQNKPLGEIGGGTDKDSFDRNTVLGGMEYIIAYAKETWGCPVVFYTGTKYDSDAYQAMVDTLPALQEKWGIGVIDLWNDTEMNTVSAEQRAFYMNDNIHPTQAGYLEWWVPKMQAYLYDFVARQ